MGPNSLWTAGILLAGAAWTQKPAVTPVATGTVTGHVICGDTQLPARFAEVSLVRKPSQQELAAVAKPEGKGWLDEGPDLFELQQARTGLDGSYTVSQVPPGDYWLVARRDGYLFPIGLVLDETMPRDLDKMMAGAPVVHVSADRPAQADLTLERGAVVAGQVLFDDGSAAADWKVWLLPVGAVGVTPLDSPYDDEASEEWRPGRTSTDDEGRFRMAGISPGKYLVVTALSMGQESSGGQRVLVYGPGVFSRAAAKPVAIHAAETVADFDLKLDLSQLHSIRGRVLKKADGLPLIEPAIVDVFNGSSSQRTHSASDGSFRLDFLPPGTYTLHVVPSFPNPKDRTRHFEHPSLQVVVGKDDVTVDDILLGERLPDQPKE